MRWQTRRSSTFLDGVRHDAALVVDPSRDRRASASTDSAQSRRHEPRWDVIVVGARVAGAATAMLLARAGLRVLCVDRARYGSDTLSTHALMRGGVLQLQRWGLLDAVVAAGTPPVRRTVFHYGDEAVAGVDQAGARASTRCTRRGARCSTRLLVDAAARGRCHASVRHHRHGLLPRIPTVG